MEKLIELKKWLKQWERKFVEENKRRPSAEDIRSSPKDVIDAYKRYADAKKNSTGTESTPCGEKHRRQSSHDSQSTNAATEAGDSSAEMLPWGAELNKKEEKLAEVAKSTKDADEVSAFMQRVGHKLLAKANLGSSPQKTKKDGSDNCRDESSDLADPIPSMSHFGKAKKLAEKQQQAAKLLNSTDGVNSPFASPPGRSWEEDDSLPCNIIAMHRSKLSKSAKRFLANSRLTDEPDTRSSFAGEILECDSGTVFTAERAEKESNGRVDNNCSGSPITGCRSNNNTTDLSEHRNSPPVLQHCDPPVLHPNGYSENGHEGHFTGLNRSKRKASGCLDDGRNKRRLIVGDTADDIESNSFAVDSPVIPEAAELPEDSEALTVCAKKTTKRKPAKRCVAAPEGNFVRLNMKVKKYQRKGFKAVSGGAHKRKAWKKMMQGRQENGGNSGGNSRGNNCFKCGQAGHWARNCKGNGRKTSVPIEIEGAPSLGETARAVDDSLFLTMNEAIRMARGVRVPDKTDAPVSSVDDDPEEEELRVVRSLDGVREAPPAAQPLYQLDDDGRVPDATPEVYEMLGKFGFDSFRPGQEKVVMRVLCGLSTLVVLSTGAGKSLCYQLPAFMYGQRSKSITLVISPLVSLMDDQVMGLPPGVRGACLHTNLSKPQRQKVIDGIVAGSYHFLLISPETLVGSGANSSLPSVDQMPAIGFACIDEVHCVSEWSHHFRPSYLRLYKVLKERFGVKCILGLTATATMATIRSISHNLGISDCDEATVRGKAMPDNLHLSISRDEEKDGALINMLQGGRFSECQSIIIYCTRRQQTDNVASLIRTHMKQVLPPEPEPTKTKTGKKKTAKKKAAKGVAYAWTTESYHAGLTPGARRRVQNNFMCGKLRVVVATVAFGMGLDKSDVRGIIHYNLPKSFESYVQEVGRAGRDGKPAYCHVFLDREGKDMNELKRHIYSNTIDRSGIKKLLRDVFPPCRCREAQQLRNHQDESSDVSTSLSSGRVCPGHERAIPIDAMVQRMDMKEEGIDTLLCYLELHEQCWLESLRPVYATCTLTCYGGAAQLQAVSRKCPPVAVAIAMEKHRGVSHASCSRLQFAVVELSDRVGWNSGLVKRELKQLQWGATDDGLPRKSGVLVEFSDLAFHLRSPGDLTDSERDEVTAFLVERLESQEETELQHLQHLYNTFYRVSHTDVWMCMDEVDEDRSVRLKANIFSYFDKASKKTADTDEATTENSVDESGPAPPVLFKIPGSLSSGRADIGNFISLYGSEHRLSGRSIARIFHGIPSPCFPADVWGRVRRFWRSYLNVDFNVLRKLASQELLHYK